MKPTSLSSGLGGNLVSNNNSNSSVAGNISSQLSAANLATLSNANNNNALVTATQQLQQLAAAATTAAATAAAATTAAAAATTIGGRRRGHGRAVRPSAAHPAAQAERQRGDRRAAGDIRVPRECRLPPPYRRSGGAAARPAAVGVARGPSGVVPILN